MGRGGDKYVGCAGIAYCIQLDTNVTTIGYIHLDTMGCRLPHCIQLDVTCFLNICVSCITWYYIVSLIVLSKFLLKKYMYHAM